MFRVFNSGSPLGAFINASYRGDIYRTHFSDSSTRRLPPHAPPCLSPSHPPTLSPSDPLCPGMNQISKQSPSFDMDALDPFVHGETGEAEPATALIIGARHGVIYSVDYLISKGAKLDIAAPNDGNTALHEAARQGHLRVVVSLVEGGADVTKVNKDGKTAAQLATESGYSLVAKTIESPGSVTVGDIAMYTRNHLPRQKSMNLMPVGCWGQISKFCLTG